jgi:proteic killer suppression protein
MILSFRCKHTQHLFYAEHSRRFARIQDVALRKLRLLAAAESLATLRVPPGNHLEALQGDRRGQYSIRISAQWRICFEWENGHAHEVAIVDDH